MTAISQVLSAAKRKYIGAELHQPAATTFIFMQRLQSQAPEERETKPSRHFSQTYFCSSSWRKWVWDPIPLLHCHVCQWCPSRASTGAYGLDGTSDPSSQLLGLTLPIYSVVVEIRLLLHFRFYGERCHMGSDIAPLPCNLFSCLWKVISKELKRKKEFCSFTNPQKICSVSVSSSCSGRRTNKANAKPSAISEFHPKSSWFRHCKTSRSSSVFMCL